MISETRRGESAAIGAALVVLGLLIVQIGVFFHG